MTHMLPGDSITRGGTHRLGDYISSAITSITSLIGSGSNWVSLFARPAPGHRGKVLYFRPGSKTPEEQNPCECSRDIGWREFLRNPLRSRDAMVKARQAATQPTGVK